MLEVGSCALVTDHARQEVFEVQALQKVLTAPDADFLEDVGEVALNGVFGDEECTRDLAVGEAAHHELHDLFFAWAEAVGGDVQPRHLLRLGWLNDDHRLAGAIPGGLCERAVEREPTSRAATDTDPRYQVVIVV